MAEPTKCALNACTCTTSGGRAFCSDYCQHTATSGPPRQETVCQCGHDHCEGERAHAASS